MPVDKKRTKLLWLSNRILLLFAGALLGVMVAEGTARLFLSRQTPEPVVPIEIGRFDNRLGWSKIPNTHGVSNKTGEPIEYRINSKGLRDEETSYEKPENTFRIVLIGDSFTFGYGIPIEQHFSTLLGGYFANVEVINMGIDGFGVDQELLFLQIEGFKYEPDLVLAYVPGYYEHRHMHTIRFGKSKPRFLLVDGELTLTNSPVPDNMSVRPTGQLRKINLFFGKHSLAYGILRNGFVNLIRRGPPAPSVIEQRQGDAQNSDDGNFMNEMHEVGLALILAMQGDSLDHGAEFVLITHMSDLHEAALEEGVLSLDVSTPLANPAFELPGNLKHINESGNGVLAWEITTFLQANRLIPGISRNYPSLYIPTKNDRAVDSDDYG
jgi:hypothetical protein